MADSLMCTLEHGCLQKIPPMTQTQTMLASQGALNGSCDIAATACASYHLVCDCSADSNCFRFSTECHPPPHHYHAISPTPITCAALPLVHMSVYRWNAAHVKRSRPCGVELLACAANRLPLPAPTHQEQNRHSTIKVRIMYQSVLPIEGSHHHC